MQDDTSRTSRRRPVSAQPRTGRAAPEPIAIVGAACRLPGAPDLESFWTLVASGTDAVGTLPADRFNQAAFLHPRKSEPGRSYSFAAGHLGDIANFDAAAFGLSPREAMEMDPQQRLLLEVAAEAVEDAGIPAAALANRPLTTVTQDAAIAGRKLVEVLLAQIRGEPVEPLILPTRLIVRQSSEG